MKNTSKLISAIVAILICCTLSFIPSCKKDKKTNCGENATTRTQIIEPGEPSILGRFYSGNGTKADLSSFDVTETDIDGILSSYGLTLLTGENPIGLALLYPGSIDTTNLAATNPIAICVYKEVGDRIWAQLYNKTAGAWLENSKIWGITTTIATNALYKDMMREELSVQNLVILQSGSFPETSYVSDFEVKLNNPGGDFDDPTGGCSPCGLSSPCNTQTEGLCKNLGSGNYFCDPCAPGTCKQQQARIMLTDNSYPISISIFPQLYAIKDSVLRKTKSRAKFIDDYYYACLKVGDGFDLDLALSAYDIWSTNVIRKLANVTNPAYADTVIITLSEKNKLLHLCSVAGNYSADVRYQVIVDSLRANINRYNGKTISYLNDHF